MTPFQLEALEYGWIYLAVAAASSAAQWYFAANSPLRLASALHGVLFIGAFLLGVAGSPLEDASVYLLVPLLGLAVSGAASCLTTPFLRASPLGIAIPTSILSLGAGAYLTLFGMLALGRSWF